MTVDIVPFYKGFRGLLLFSEYITEIIETYNKSPKKQKSLNQVHFKKRLRN